MTDSIDRVPEDKVPGLVWGGLYPRPFNITAPLPIADAADALRDLEIPREGYFQAVTRTADITVEDLNTTRFTLHELRRNRGVDYDSAVAFGTLRAVGGDTTDITGYIRYGFSFFVIIWLAVIVFFPVIGVVSFVLAEEQAYLWWIPVVATVFFGIAMTIVWWFIDRDRKRLLAALESIAGESATE